MVAEGVPGPGAGTIETPGATDLYTFTARAGQTVYFQVKAASPSSLHWNVTDAADTVVFDTCLCGDAGAFQLRRGGQYTITVGSATDAQVGTYQFRLWDVRPPDHFAIAIGDTVAEGVPGPGAGAIETPGTMDLYTFTARAGQTVYFQVKAASPSSLHWNVTDAAGTVVFDTCLCGDAGAFQLKRGGQYTITVGSATDAQVGTYQFRLWDVRPPDHFAIAIGDTVAEGVPGPGAGAIETPGTMDLYTFTARAGQTVYFQVKAASPSSLHWNVTDAAGTVVFDTCLCGDAGAFQLKRGGQYTITVGSATDAQVGTYQFRLWDVRPPDHFAIAIGDTVAEGVPGPGAGAIETLGTMDLYTFTARAGQTVYFQVKAAAPSSLHWNVTDAAGTVVFDTCLCGGAGALQLRGGGQYTITVGSATDAQVGTYQFRLWDARPPDHFAIAIGDTVAEGVPGPGAGTLETLGTMDLYTFTARAGQTVYFQVKAAAPSSLHWNVTDAAGTVVFDTCLCGDAGAFQLRRGGHYTITVGST